MNKAIETTFLYSVELDFFGLQLGRYSLEKEVEKAIML